MSTLTVSACRERILSYMPSGGTEDQQAAISRISNFLVNSGGGDTYLLKGYAGTGKTTIISAVVRALRDMGIRTLLLAPTGRAAKVVAGYSGRPAYTIHRRIYKTRLLEGGGMVYETAPNSYKDTIVIVDEASMIQEGNGAFGDSNVLSDLITYVKSGENCRMMLIGDTAQLPPVGEEHSPALDIRKISKYYGLRSGHFELTEVVRQESDSGILANATAIRNAIRERSTDFKIDQSFTDVRVLNHELLQEKLNDAFSLNNGDSIVITRSNKAAVGYNRQIRYSALWYQEELDGGDLLMCTRNSYYWLDETSPLGFIANGDILKVKGVQRYEDRYGFRFATVTATFVDYPDHPSFETKLILNSLHAASNSLPPEDNKSLYNAALLSLPPEISKTARHAALSNDSWLQALQVKFAYAVTCHKAQGGQWDTVFIDAYNGGQETDISYLRWLYTAFTRAKKQVYLMNAEGLLDGD